MGMAVLKEAVLLILETRTPGKSWEKENILISNPLQGLTIAF
jgi:hypothetical protein